MTVFDEIKAGGFRVFVEIAGADEDLTDYPVLPIRYLYGKHFKRGAGGEPVDFDHLRESVSGVTTPNGLAIIDLEDKRVEGLTSWNEAALVRDQHTALAQQVIATIRAAQPDWQLGWFGHAPNITCRHFNGYHAYQGEGAQGKRHAEYLWAARLIEHAASELGPVLDFCHPELYFDAWHWGYAYDQDVTMDWYFHQRDSVLSPVSPLLLSQRSPQRVWEDTAVTGLKLVRDCFPEHPIIPAISPQWWPPAGDARKLRGQFFAIEWLQRQLDLVRLYADSVVIWLWPIKDGWTLQAWLDSERWRLICDWAQRQQATENGAND